MAKDVSTKSVPNASNSDSSSSTIQDQQKVPPLRIVLNTSGNQKSSTNSISVTPNQSQDSQRRDKTIVNSTVKTTGRVRIRLGTGKQATGKGNASSQASKTASDDAQKLNKPINETSKEELVTNYSHLRRITRRSQRSIQLVTNEDEESISSMTSTDENAANSNIANNATTNNINDDSSLTQDNSAAAGAGLQNQPGSIATTNNESNQQNSSSNQTSVEPPRRYKRRKGEPSESSSIDHDSLFGFRNYKLPNQNSFELYRNIRKQVDKKLKNLNIIQPKTPHGIRDYMIARGAYLLDGNKLGNGTNLFMNEDGGLFPVQTGRYHTYKYNRINYTVPNRDKVPLCLSLNSPLYNLFIEQEKERYRMRIQHIKEREKLTLAAEQEIVRVYNQAALVAANQDEPFSACTMLRHQEVYNYLDADGQTILSSDDVRHEQTKPDGGVRTRRRQQEQMSPVPSSSLDNNTKPTEENLSDANKESRVSVTNDDNSQKCDEEKGKVISGAANSTTSGESDKSSQENSDKQNDIKIKNNKEETSSQSATDKIEKRENESDLKVKEQEVGIIKEPDLSTSSDVHMEVTEANSTKGKKKSDNSKVKQETNGEKSSKDINSQAESKNTNENPPKPNNNQNKPPKQQHQNSDSNVDQKHDSDINKAASTKETFADKEETSSKAGHSNIKEEVAPMDMDNNEQLTEENPSALHLLSDEEQQANDREIFLTHLQDIDDKWEKIRNEMLIRHRNEAESLHAIQKLEWEWKVKEIGACDVRTTPIIDNTLVPKLNIYLQDY